MQPIELTYASDVRAPPRAWSLAKVRTRVASMPLGWIVPLLALCAWFLASRFELVSPQILPGPELVSATLIDLVSSGELPRNFAVSLGRVAGGFAAGVVAGALLGIVMGVSRRTEQYLYPAFKAMTQVPTLGWIPLLMMIVGIGESLKIIIIAHAALVPVALNTLKGIRSIPVAYLEVAKVFTLRPLRLVREVVLPAAFPQVFVGLRYGLKQSWTALVTVELLASSEGIGFLMVWGRQLFQLDVVLVAILVIGVVGVTLDSQLARAEARLMRWRREAF